MVRHPALVWTAYLLAWVACGWFGWQRFHHARHEFDDPNRADGCSGYVQIDFAGQWVMGRLFAADGRHLYHRDRQRELVRQAFSPADADALMGWFVGEDSPAGDGIGGPLYPPVHGLLYSPLARLDPLAAYRLFQALSFGFAAFAGLAISRATGGRLWLPVAVVGVLTIPGGRGGFDLGQNHMLTLAVLAGGWWAMAAGRWTLGGTVWGLLALKPTWAIAFLPVPLVMGQWRASAAMCGAAGGLILATLPAVGVAGWLDWLTVGRRASEVYAVNSNWVSFSRDLFGLPRRLLIDFAVPETERGSRLAAGLGWGLWAVVVTGTAVVYRSQKDRRPAGLAAGFLLLGAYLGCYRFMYYDAALAALPIGLMLADRRCWRWVPVGLAACLYLYENWLIHYSPELCLARGGIEPHGHRLISLGGERLALTLTTGTTTDRYAVGSTAGRLFTLAGNYRYAWDTAFLLALWVWAGWRLRSRPAEGVEGGPDVGRPHQRLADQHG